MVATGQEMVRKKIVQAKVRELRESGKSEILRGHIDYFPSTFIVF